MLDNIFKTNFCPVCSSDDTCLLKEFDSVSTEHFRQKQKIVKCKTCGYEWARTIEKSKLWNDLKFKETF